MSEYLDAVQRGPVVFDGATGTWLQARGLGPDDFGGPHLDGCNEVLNVTRPDLIAELHRAYLDAGAAVIETNTFGAFAVPLGEYDISDRAYELAAAGATIARRAADAYGGRWVAGSIGPGTKFATLGQITYRELRDAYEVEAAGLIDGGSDLLIIETQFDLLGVKAAVNGARRAMRTSGRVVPLQVQVTIELTGRMLPGTEIAAACAAIEALGPDVIGINCATGPVEMYEPVRHLAATTRLPISVIPNAGLPSVVDGQMHYDLSADEMARHLATFVSEFGVSVVGGCCGSTPDYIATLVEHLTGVVPAIRTPTPVPAVTSTYGAVPLHQDTSFLIIGERTNANGSRAFRDAMLDEDIDACVAIGEDQVAEGAHLVDLCVDYVGRDGAADIAPIAARFATEVTAPIVIDSTEPDVMEAALERIGGRCILNSANLEDGDGPGSRLDRVLTLAREHGAAVICLLIDERGQARDLEWKMDVARRLHEIATTRYGLSSEDLIFDALTFPLSTGDEDLRRDAIATIEAIRGITAEFPRSATVLGVSNVSFGLKPAARRALNSVFLHECVAAGLDAAIIHAGRIAPLNELADDVVAACLDLIHDRHDERDPLAYLMAAFDDAVAAAPRDPLAGLAGTERVERRIVAGIAQGLEDDLDQLMASLEPMAIINDVLLAGMRTVGELFASGDMQLPFVLRSAQTMKAAVKHLEPHLDHVDAADRGSIVLATVSGDVHDIGKNLVDIILSNNGYRVHNLGIKVSIAEMIEAFEAHNADAIGMSGLLVKSTLVMRDNLEELERRGHGRVPVLLGGAALTRSYVEDDLATRHEGPVIYGKDAFAGLAAMRWITGEEASPPGAERRWLPPRSPRATDPTGPVPERSPTVAASEDIPAPPFLGSRIVKGIPIDDIARYLNTTALLRNQWQYRPEAGEDDGAFKERMAPEIRSAIAGARAADLLRPQVVYGYFTANADRDAVIIWEDADRTTEMARFAFPRQEVEPWLCIADFFRPVEDGPDVAAFHIVTMGAAVSERTAELFAADRYEAYLKLHGLGVEMTEALAEYWHARIRGELGIADDDDPTIRGLFRQGYRGGRYSWGYPACPDLEDNLTVATLLGASRIGVEVGPNTGYQYQPEQTTSAIICHHRGAKYFIARTPREQRHADSR